MFKARVTKNGYDAGQDHGPKDYRLHEGRPALKVVLEGSGITSGTYPITVTIRHDLGYMPIVFFYFGGLGVPDSRYLATGDVAAGMPYIYNTRADLNNIIIENLQDGVPYHYIILADETIS